MFTQQILADYIDKKFILQRLDLIKTVASIEAKIHCNTHSQVESVIYFQYRTLKSMVPDLCKEIDGNFVTLLNFQQIDQYRRLITEGLDKVRHTLEKHQHDLAEAGKQRDLNQLYNQVYQKSCEVELSRYLEEVVNVLDYVNSKFKNFEQIDLQDEILNENSDVRYSIIERLLILEYLHMNEFFKYTKIHEDKTVQGKILGALFNNSPEKVRQSLSKIIGSSNKVRLEKIRPLFTELPEIIEKIDKDYLKAPDQ